jgi:hypothetical protein
MIEHSMVRAGKRHRQASLAAKSVACNPLTRKEIEGWSLYLNSVEFGCTVVKPLEASFPSERELANLARSMPPTL